MVNAIQTPLSPKATRCPRKCRRLVPRPERGFEAREPATSIVTLQFGQYGNQLGPAFFRHFLDCEEEAGSPADGDGPQPDKRSYADVSDPFRRVSGALRPEGAAGRRAAPQADRLGRGKPRVWDPGALRPLFDLVDTEGIDLSGPAPLPAPCIRPRAILVDMEPKAIMSSCILNSSLPCRYSGRGIVHGQSGSGNNWAYGFREHGNGQSPVICDLARRMAESQDRLGGFFCLQSLGGGTGSGLGSRVLLDLRDAFPRAEVVSQCVLPYRRGEVLTQEYNATLSLGLLLSEASGVLLTGNDDSSAILRNTAAGVAGHRPTLFELNEVIAHGLAMNLCRDPRVGAGFLSSLVRDCVPSPLHRLLDFRATPSLPSTVSREAKWYGVCSTARQMLLTRSVGDSCLDWRQSLAQGNCAARVLAARVSLHGRGAGGISTGLVDLESLLEMERPGGAQGAPPGGSPPGAALSAGIASLGRVQVQQLKAECQRNQEASDLLLAGDYSAVFATGRRPLVRASRGYERPELPEVPGLRAEAKPLSGPAGKEDRGATQDQPAREFRYGKSAGLVVNGDTHVAALSVLCEGMKRRLESGAYLWHYEKFGVEKDDIRDALEVLVQVLYDYSL